MVDFFRTSYPSTCGDLRGTSAGFTPVDLDRQFVDYFSTDICRSLKLLWGKISNFLKPCVKPRPIFSNLVLNPDQSGSQERTRPWWREWRERDLFSTPPTHLVCSSHCVTRAPLLYFIRSWVALSFKVVSQSVRHAWHHYKSPLFAIYKGMNVLYWPSIINYQLLPPHSVLYWPSTQLHHLVTHSWANWI